MIVKMKDGTTEASLNAFKQFLKDKGFETKNASSGETIVLGIIGDTKSLDESQLYTFDDVYDVIRIQSPFKQASRTFKKDDTKIAIKDDIVIGGESSVLMAGPCSVENPEQMDTVAKFLSKKGVKILRGGAYKPRTSPYTFQGLGLEGLKLLKETGDRYHMAVVSEIPSVDLLETFEQYVDIIQIGARNMQNFHLLKALGRTDKPILLKRGLASTIEEWLMSAEYIINAGNPNVILMERGIRTFEPYTRNTLDLSAVLAVKERSHLPVLVDPSHASGKWQMIESLSKAALAVGADGLMVEVHHNPQEALSDGAQSLKLDTFETAYDAWVSLSKTLGRPLQ